MVLPSFKVGFSIIPESSPTNSPQRSDDLNSTSRSYLPSTTQQQQQHSWTNDPSRSISASIITPSSSSPHSQQISRPTVSSIPISLIPGHAPAFGLRRRTISSLNSSIENEQNPSFSFQNGKRPNSPTVHAGAYKRPRGHSICSGSSSYVKLPSQTSSDLVHSIIPSSIPLQISSNNIPTTNQHKDRKQYHNNTFRSSNPQLPHLQNPHPSSSLSLDITIPVSHQNSTPPKPLHPSTSDIQRSNIPRTSNLVSFAPLSLSHRSGGSKQQSHGFQGSLLNADYIEDSTCRLPVDVLGSPRQKSLNSIATARTTHVLGNNGAVSNQRAQTTSDWSNIYPNRTNTPSNPQNAIVDGTDTLNRERNHYNTQLDQNKSNDRLQPILSDKAELAHTNISTDYNPRVTDQQNIPISRSINSLPHVSSTPSIPNTSGSGDSAKPIPLPKQSLFSTSSLPIASASITLPLAPNRSVSTSLFSGPTTFAQTSSQPQLHQQALVASHSGTTPQSTSFPVIKEDPTSIKQNVKYLPYSSGIASSSIPHNTSSPFLVQTSSATSKYMTIPSSSSNQVLPISSTTLPKRANENENIIPIPSTMRIYQNPSHGAGSSQSPEAFSKPSNADDASRPSRKDLWGQNTRVSTGMPPSIGAGSASTLPYGYSEFSGPTNTLTGIPEPSIRPSPSTSYGNVYRNSTSTWIPSMSLRGDNRILDERSVAMTPTNQITQAKIEGQPALSQQNPGPSSRISPRNSAVPIVARRTPGSIPQQHLSDEQGHVQCPHCSRKLRNQVTLHNHIRVVHDNSGNFQCPQCIRTFMWKSTLGIHMRLVHEKQRPHACEECDKAFRWKSHLREHQSVEHKGERPFKCPNCGKAFGRKNNMQKHMRKHNENQ